MAKPIQSYRRVTFVVRTAKALPLGEQVFIAGNHSALGDWSADGYPLTRIDDTEWSGWVLLPDGEGCEFKVTRGSWATEQVGATGAPHPNQAIRSGGDVVQEVHVNGWKDMHSYQPEITGLYRIHDDVPSEYLDLPRRVIVWLPPSYETDAERRYPVLYMHDGQQVFDPHTSTHQQDWEVDEWCTQLIDEGKIDAPIVVAIYSTADRAAEYDPAAKGADYVRFLADELKPFIDKTYRTAEGAASVAGASRGGTISLYAAWTRPDAFLSCACLSPVFDLDGDRTCLDLVATADQVPVKRVYLYCGRAGELEQRLLGGMREMAETLHAKGLTDEGRLLVAENPHGEHNEAAWCDQCDEWLQFLFSRKNNL